MGDRDPPDERTGSLPDAPDYRLAGFISLSRQQRQQVCRRADLYSRRVLDALQPSRAGRPWSRSPIAALSLACAAALVVGVLAVAASPLAVAAAVAGLALASVVLARPVAGLLAFVAIVGTLPFGVIPLQVGVQLTFVDAILITTFGAFLVRLPALAAGFRLSGPGLWLGGFMAIAVVAFLVGAGTLAAPAEQMRRFGKLLASLLVFVVALNLVRTRAPLHALVRALMLAGALAGAVGAVLWRLPPSTQLTLLSSLRVVGYPTSDVLRYVPGPNETYTSQLRATGTAVDPNVFGGTLMLAAALIGFQWLARDRLFPQPVLLLLGLPTLAGILASFSRASWLGLAVGVLLVGSLRYRRIWLIVPVALAGLLLLPAGQNALERFVTGFSSSDPATALRLGEYRNALTIIQRYPLVGIGFGQSPDIDVTAGVSSVYLLVGEQMGLIGLALYLAALVGVFLTGLGGLRVARDERLYGVLSGLLAAFTAALVAGFLDHYFANQVFPHAVALFWLYAGLLVSAAFQAKDAAPETTAAQAV